MPRLALLALALLAPLLGAGHDAAGLATCKGSRLCTACKTCKLCFQCNANGGTCGVCDPSTP